MEAHPVRRGRPPFPPGQARVLYVNLRVSPSEHATIKLAAARSKQTVAEYCRELLLDVAGAELRGELG